MSTRAVTTASDALDGALDNLDPDTVTVTNPVELRAIAEYVDQIEETQQLINGAVRAARAAGYSWARIALALNVSRQAAHEKYSGLTR